MTDPVRFPDPFPPPFANAWGDDRYGLWAAIVIDDGAEVVTQILRWIEPGTFLMGSPDDEPERSGDEGPQHWVTISQGYWLADTACTQALWQTVMGNNPSRFHDAPNNPVEQVSWLDVQQFLGKLQVLLPGCRVDLPSEAEWEYGCRAGTDMPFSFGANITPAQANYKGKNPYAGGEKGEYRRKTVRVKSLPANPWGLYEMHGNVFEWCKDGLREYGALAQIDPLGPTDQDQPYVVRGGYFDYVAGRTRSAYRHAFPPDLVKEFSRAQRAAHRYVIQPGIANFGLGFRLCLRSIQPGQAAGGPTGSPGRTSGASPEI